MDKDALVEKTKAHIANTRAKITEVIFAKEKKRGKMSKDSLWMTIGDKIAQHTLLAYNKQQLENLKQLYPSPYFARCDWEMNGERKTLYFAKFSFGDEGIYSWITPVAQLRFENPGSASYTKPNGSVQSGTIYEKDQYMIVDGKLLFYTTEGISNSRELIYQENFTQHKQGFVLPDVVAQMEQAQDQVIRANFRGPFVISGPAGSGKTTLALHRVAYLMQSPETMEFFEPHAILILVQDTGTKKYFSHLLPELGIKGIEIVTFNEWAVAVLNLTDHTITTRIGKTDTEKNLYEFAKLQALKNSTVGSYNKNIFGLLEKNYLPYFTENQIELFNEQKKKKLLDRFDLTILLYSHKKTFTDFKIKKQYYEELTNGEYRKVVREFPAKYNLMIIDEFENYLPEQIVLLKSCLNERTNSIVYVGDLAQQTQLGTIQNWDDIAEDIQPDRLVTLQKVYRNTKQILHYIQNLGYAVNIPEEIKQGIEVQEKILNSKEEEIAYINSNLNTETNFTIGILVKDAEYIQGFKNTFGKLKNVFCLTMQESQGVEFDKVFLVGFNKNSFATSTMPKKLEIAVRKVEKDLLYVALTRAMSELHILGKEKLYDCTRILF